MIFGGHIEDMPRPLKRFFSDKRRKKKVRVVVTCFYSVGMHYYISLTEEEDLIWDGKDWRIPWDDEEGKGKRVDSKVNTSEEVEREVNRLFEYHFSKKTHRLTDIYCGKKKWYYREGD